MKHNIKITALLITMFLIAQFIGIFVVHHYMIPTNVLPFGLGSSQPQTGADFGWFFYQIVVAFILAVLILTFLSKIKSEWILRIWFYVVVVIAMTVSFLAIFPNFSHIIIISTAIAAILGYFKIFRHNVIVHNLTELIVYPGIAAVFVPLLNLWTALILLVMISVYDIWAVWHSGIMQKMAKYNMNTLKIFPGFFVPHISKRTKQKIKKWKSTLKKSELGEKKIQVNVAILGGGDIVFPMITAGVILGTKVVNVPWGLPAFVGGLVPAIFVSIGAALGLTYLLITSNKKQFYPAMPFITGGIFIGLLAAYLLL